MNYQSIPRRFNKPTSSINHAYIDSVLRQKQSTIDSNFGLLQQSVEQVLGQDLIRESDRVYLKDKVKEVLNTLENNDSINFASNKSKFTIPDALSEAAKDPEVLRQISNTKKIRQIQKFYQDRLNKGNLSQQNFQYAYEKSGVNLYLSGNSNDLSDFNYTEYIDLDAKMDESARKLKASNPNEKVSIQNPLTGETVTKKVSMLSPQEMRNYLKVQLNAEDLKQLEIDGAMMYGLNNDTAIQYRDSMIESSNKKYLDKINSLEKLRDHGNRTPGQIREINSQIEAIRAEKSNYEKSLIGQTTAEVIGGQQILENKLEFYSNLYTKNGPESIKYDSDFIKRMRDANAASNQATISALDVDVSTITTPTNLEGKIDPYQDSLNRTNKTLKENSDYLKSQFNLLSEDKKKIIEDKMKEIQEDPTFLSLFEGQDISNETLQLETINRLGANFFPPDVAKELRSRISSTRAINNAINETTSKFVKTKVTGEEFFNQLFNEELKLTMVDTKGNDINIKQFLENNGVSDKKSYESFISSDSKEAKQLRATLAVQSLNLQGGSISDAQLTDNPFETLSNVLTQSSNNPRLSETEYRILRQSIHDLTGESLEKTYNINKEGSSYRLELKNDTTKFFKIVNRTNQLSKLGGTGSIGDTFLEAVGVDIDRTVRNESSLKNLFSEDNYKEFAKNNLDLIDKTVSGSNLIRVQGDIKKKVGPIYQEILREVSNAPAFDLTDPIDIYRQEDGNLLVSQSSIINKEDGKQSIKNITGIVQANDVKKMNIFNEQITLSKQETTFKNLEDFAGKINHIAFIENDREQVEGLNRLYSNYTNDRTENLFRKLSSSNTARKNIFTPNVDQYLPQGHPIRLQFEDFVNNTQNYNLEFTKGIDSPYQVLIKNNENENVGNIPLNENISLEVFEKALLGSPQVFFSIYTKSLVSKYMNQIIDGRN